ncbi:MAG: cyclase [Ardenticatenaceae bacterium]|nr:cyclase [Ardenticatenaceae bacterium]MCB9445432.1 cyclase [Ardenticatenaceae bacterium]
MGQYRHRFEVEASLTAVSNFHSDSRALRMLTPPPIWVQFHLVESLAEGSVADFTMWLGLLPVRWTAVHSQVTPHGFTDTQKRGPFKTWVHSHRFQELGNGRTAVVDDIEAEPGNLISRFMWLTLPVLFAYRGWRTRWALR